MKYICWETFQKAFVKSEHYHHEMEKSFVELRRILENLLKFMDVSNETHKTQVMQLAGKNISAIFLGVKNTFWFCQWRQLCNDKQAPAVLVNFKLIVRRF